MIDKGKTAPLLHTVKGRERILVALNWDERGDKITMMDKLRGTNQQHDLDIACFVFDDQGTYIDFVGAMAQDAMDSTGAIYHSGDDTTGEGLADDESISVELGSLPLTTKDIIFIAEIRSDHAFGEIARPSVRIADGATDKNLLRIELGGTGNENAHACVVARITRDRKSQTGWSLHHIGDHPDLAGITDWAEHLRRYL